MNKVKDDNRDIAKAILKIREDNKLSQEQFAEKLGVTRQAVSRWEMGISIPNINSIILMSEEFGVSLDTMLKENNNVDLKSENDSSVSAKRNKRYGFLLLMIGLLGLAAIPFLAKWQQIKNMELFKTAYEHSYDYILEYPLSIIFMLALLFAGLGVYFIFKSKEAI